MLICISHGSGGVGENEWNIAEFFLSKGYNVSIIDYFTPHRIKKLFWDYRSHNQDHHTVSFKSMFDYPKIPNYIKKVHIGCSLGGFFGIYHSEKFNKNFCFYPGVFSFTKRMLKKDYSNTTVFFAKKDTWCDNYYTFHNQCKNPPTLKVIDANHGFMIPNKDVVIPIAKYHFSNNPISDLEFSNLMPNHKHLSSIYSYDKSTILLQYDEKHCIMCLNNILEEIKNL